MADYFEYSIPEIVRFLGVRFKEYALIESIGVLNLKEKHLRAMIEEYFIK